MFEVAACIYEDSDMSIEMPIEGWKGGKAGKAGKRTFVYENETQVVASGILLVNFAERGGKVEAA